MDEHDRVKRPAPERTEPKRQWTESFASSRVEPNSPTDPKDPRDAAYQTVNDAYRLIDDYMRQGQQMAENFWLPLGSAATPFREAPERFMRALGDMTMAWVEVMQQWTSNASGGAPQATGRAAPFQGVDPGPNGPSEHHVKDVESKSRETSPLRVSVVASVPIELVVDVTPFIDVGALMITELRDPANASSPISEVYIARDEHGEGCVKVIVPESHPAGTYSGLFLDTTTRRPRGTLSLKLLSRG